MRSAIVSVGSELIDGFVTDTNATFLAQEMVALGIELVGVFQVGDNLDRLVRTLRRAWEDAELIVTTGGIGPTDDDLTRESIAALLDERVAVDQELLRVIERFFGSRGIPMPEQNAKQAWLIPSASVLPNPMGTAPGWFVQKDAHVIVSMPGVPREMMRMWREQAVPRLLPYLGDRVVKSVTLKTIGIGESAAERMIADIIRRGFPIVATYAKDDGVHIRVTASAPRREEAEDAVRRTEFEVRDVMQHHIYGTEEVSLGAAILAPLMDSGKTLAISEAGAGGRTSSLLAEEPAADVSFHGGLERSFDHVAGQHGIDPTDEDAHIRVASREAAAIRSEQHADYGLGVAVRLTTDPSPDRTAGDVALCLTDGSAMLERQHRVRAVPPEIRRRAALWAAEFLWNGLRHGLGQGE